jgi:hypothetical protein
MKKFGLTLSLVLALGGNAMAHGCWGFWPGFSVGIGLGGVFGCSLGVCAGCGCYCGCGYPAYSYAYSQPACAYSQPAYACAPPTGYVDPPQPSAWVPRTPGAGRWVPDPTPYSYTPRATTTRPAEAKTALRRVVTMIRSGDGIPIYSVSYLK